MSSSASVSRKNSSETHRELNANLPPKLRLDRIRRQVRLNLFHRRRGRPGQYLALTAGRTAAMSQGEFTTGSFSISAKKRYLKTWIRSRSEWTSESSWATQWASATFFWPSLGGNG